MVFDENSVRCVLHGSGVNTPEMRSYLKSLGYKLSPTVESGADCALIANDVTPGKVSGCPHSIAHIEAKGSVDCGDNVMWFMVLTQQADVDEINKHFSK
jgi:hypothetical protein